VFIYSNATSKTKYLHISGNIFCLLRKMVSLFKIKFRYFKIVI